MAKMHIFKTKKNNNINNNQKNRLYAETEYDANKDFNFSSLSFNEWYKIVQYVINYDLICSNLEYLDELNLRLKQLQLFIDYRGIIPNDEINVLKKYNDEYDNLIRQKNEQYLDSDNNETFNEYTDLYQTKVIENKIRQKILKEQNNNQSLYLLFKNPYFLNSKNQEFDLRSKSLQLEKNIINKNIKLIKPYKKRYLRNLDVFEEQVKKILFDQNFNFKKLFDFVRPYINQIVSSDDYYYTKLVEKTMFND